MTKSKDNLDRNPSLTRYPPRKGQAYLRREVEVKLHVLDAGKLVRDLRRLGARKIIPRTHESNVLYDTPAQNLARQGKLIRIRSECPCGDRRSNRVERAGHAVLTFKGPCGSFRKSRKAVGVPGRTPRYKMRDEAEVLVADGERLGDILAEIGLMPVFRYEKFRTTYRLPGIPGLKIEFDETPVGLFLELEGRPAVIDRAARLLGFLPEDFLISTYGDLYIADCKRRGIRPSDMLFPPTKKLQ